MNKEEYEKIREWVEENKVEIITTQGIRKTGSIKASDLLTFLKTLQGKCEWIKGEGVFGGSYSPSCSAWDGNIIRCFTKERAKEFKVCPYCGGEIEIKE